MVHLYTDLNNFKKYQSGNEEFEAWNKEAKKPGDIHISVPVDAILESSEQILDRIVIFTIKARKDWSREVKEVIKVEGSTTEGDIAVQSFQEDNNFVMETEYKGFPTKLSIELEEVQNNPYETMRIIFAKSLQLSEVIKKINSGVSVVKDIDLTKGSGQLYGEGEYLGRIKLVDNKTIKKSEMVEEDELNKSKKFEETE